MIAGGMTQGAAPLSRQVAEILAPLLARYYETYYRILHLVTIYKDMYGTGRGRRRVHKADLLRAAVVFTHAALEGLLRGLGRLYLHEARLAALDSVPLAGQDIGHRPEKFSLGSLAKHRGKTIDQLIEESVEEYLNKKSFSDTNDICALLDQIEVPIDQKIKKILPSIQELMRRRHQIVHQADRVDTQGRGKQRAASISVKQVLQWLRATRELSILVTGYIIDREYTRALGMPLDELLQLAETLKQRARQADRRERQLEN